MINDKQDNPKSPKIYPDNKPFVTKLNLPDQPQRQRPQNKIHKEKIPSMKSFNDQSPSKSNPIEESPKSY